MLGIPDELSVESQTGQGRLPVWLLAIVVVALLAWLSDVAAIKWRWLGAVAERIELQSYDRELLRWQQRSLSRQVQLRAAQSANAAILPAVLAVTGSSQMQAALPAAALRMRLQQQFADHAPIVADITLPGMPLFAYPMAAQQAIDVQADVMICWLSEFDMDRLSSPPVTQIRSLMKAADMSTYTQAMGGAESWQQRSALADLSLSAWVPLWRDRDFWRRLSQDFWGVEAFAKIPLQQHHYEHPGAEQIIHGLQHDIEQSSYAGINRVLFQKFAAQLRAAGVKLWVIEGQSAPAATARFDADGARRSRVRNWLQEDAKQYEYRYFSEQQRPQLQAADFKDPTHIGPAAAERMLAWLQNQLLQAEMFKQKGTQG